MSSNVYEQLLESSIVDNKRIQDDLIKRSAFYRLLPVEYASFIDKPDDNLKYVIQSIAEKYPVLDIDAILKMTIKEKPRFALFHIREEELIFRFSTEFPKYPKHYPNSVIVFYRNSVYKNSRSHNVWQCAFRGILPKNIRHLIDEEQGNFEHICLLQEVEKWETRLEQVNPGDPLLIGVKNKVYYLLAKFDTTTQEEYVAREFCLTNV